MQVSLKKSVCLIVFIGVLALVLPATVFAHSMGQAGGDCPSGAAQENPPIPPCCVAPGCPFPQSMAANANPASNCLTVNKDVSVRLADNLGRKASLDPDGPARPDPGQEVLVSASILRCRDSLSPEEPPLS